MILLAVVRYLADVIAGLEKQREEELRMTMHLHYTEPVTDEIMQKAGVSSDSLRRFRDAQAGETTDPQIEKLLRKAKEAAKRTSAKRASENRAGTEETIREKSGSDGKDPISAGSYEDMISVLKTRKIMIVGGHENWIKKIRRIFPDWIYIGARSGLGIKGAVQSCDKIYFYTDICGHSLYYRFLGMAAKYKKPYAYLHGINMDHVVRPIYGDLVERK